MKRGRGRDRRLEGKMGIEEGLYPGGKEMWNMRGNGWEEGEILMERGGETKVGEEKRRRAGLSHFVWEDEEGQRKNGW